MGRLEQLVVLVAILHGCSESSSPAIDYGPFYRDFSEDGSLDIGVADSATDTGADARSDAESDAENPDAENPDAEQDAATPDSIDSSLDTVPDSVSVDALPNDAVPDAPPSGCVHPSVSSSCSSNGWCQIPAGCFAMGSPPTEPCRSFDETVHEVTLAHDFEISSTVATQKQFFDLMGYSPSFFASCGDGCPVEQVSWHEAAAYCNALSTAAAVETCYDCNGSGASVSCAAKAAYSGAAFYGCQGFRLPTEAEWEYAYRAGTTTAFYGGKAIASCSCSLDTEADALGWYCGNANATTHEVGGKLANGWGLFIAGNVASWVQDRYVVDLGPGPVTDPVGATSGVFRVFRGGSWAGTISAMRAAKRSAYAPTNRFNFIGIRCVRTK